MIVLVGDHGILLGEHGYTGKVQSALYPALTRVPLIVVHPDRRRAGTASDWFASTHDLGADDPLHGRRAPARAHDRRGPVAPDARAPPARARVLLGRLLRLVLHPLARAWMLWGFNKPANLKLFNLRRDPGQFHNVAARHPDVVRSLYGKLLARAGGRLPWYGGQ